jgi:hypothetical protein
MDAIDTQLRETIDSARTAKLSELDEAKRRTEALEKMKSEMDQELEMKRLELTAEHDAIIVELKAENSVRIEKLKLDFKMEVSFYKLFIRIFIGITVHVFGLCISTSLNMYFLIARCSRCVEHVVCMGKMRDAYRNLVRKSRGQRSLGRP